MDPRSFVPAGTLLDGAYRIRRVVGAGGFGVTYEAEDTNLGTIVAIKEYFPEQFGIRAERNSVRPSSERNAETFEWGRQSFLNEARTLAQFRHLAIVRVTRVFEANSTAYMVMEFEAGRSFEAWLRALGRPPSQAELDRIVTPLLDALELMHANQFIHRDIAPDNIIIRADNSPVLLDFGAARRAIAEQSQFLTGMVKQGYSPQEQYATDGKLQGPWSDFYALGATLYRAVTGEPPAEAPARTIDDPLIPASSNANGSYRAGFLSTIDACLIMHPRKRPQTVGELRTLLEARPAGVQADRLHVPEPNSSAAGLRRLFERLPAPRLAAVALVAIAATASSVWIIRRGADRSQSEQAGGTVAQRASAELERKKQADDKAKRDSRLAEANQRWALLRTSIDIAEIERFIAQFSDTPAADLARSRLLSLRAEEEKRKLAKLRLDEAERAWEALKSSDDVEKLKRFADQFPDSPLVGRARDRIAELVKVQERNASAAKEWERLQSSTDLEQLRAFVLRYGDLTIADQGRSRIRQLELAQQEVCVIFSGEVTNEWSQKSVVRAEVTNNTLNPSKRKTHKIPEESVRWCYGADKIRFVDKNNQSFYLDMPFSGVEASRSVKIVADTAEQRAAPSLLQGRASRAGSEVSVFLRQKHEFHGNDYHAWTQLYMNAVFIAEQGSCRVVKYEFYLDDYMDSRAAYKVAHLMGMTGWLAKERPISSSITCRVLASGE